MRPPTPATSKPQLVGAQLDLCRSPLALSAIVRAAVADGTPAVVAATAAASLAGSMVVGAHRAPDPLAGIAIGIAWPALAVGGGRL